MVTFTLFRALTDPNIVSPSKDQRATKKHGKNKPRPEFESGLSSLPRTRFTRLSYLGTVPHFPLKGLGVSNRVPVGLLTD